MDNIKTTIKTLICEDSTFISRMTAYPQKDCDKLTTEQLTFFKNLKQTFDCKKNKKKAYDELISSSEMYDIIKILFESQGIRALHPVWFFIFKEQFAGSNIIIEEDLDENDIDFIKVTLPEDSQFYHSKQKLWTLNIYFSLIKNLKIEECFIDKDSEFINKYIQFKDIWKYFFFPEIEVKENNCYIDLRYNFNEIIKNIDIEINEEHHKIHIDKQRESKLYFKSNCRITHFYIKYEDLKIVLDRILDRITVGIFNKNSFAGLTFNAFIRDIIPNLTLALFFSNLDELSQNKKLTWKVFCDMCKLARITIPSNFIKEIEKETKNVNPKLKEKIYSNMFYTNLIGNKTLLKENGYDYYLIKITEEHADDSVLIKNMYSNYKIEYKAVMSMLLDDNKEEKKMLRTQNNIQNETLRNKLNETTKQLHNLQKFLTATMKDLVITNIEN